MTRTSSKKKSTASKAGNPGISTSSTLSPDALRFNPEMKPREVLHYLYFI